MKRIFLFIAIVMICTAFISCSREVPEQESDTVASAEQRKTMNVQAKITETDDVRHIIVTLSGMADKDSLNENAGIYCGDEKLEAAYNISNGGKTIDFTCPDMPSGGEFRIAKGMRGKDGTVFEETFILPIEPARTYINVADIEVEEAAPRPLHSDIGLAEGYGAEYFIPPGIVTTTVNIYILSDGDFIVNEVGGYRLTRLKADGSGKETFFQWHGPIFAFDVDAGDNAYFYEGSLNNAEDHGSIVKVEPDGDWEYLVEKEALLNSDWDTGWLAAAPDGTLYMITCVAEENRERLIKISSGGECTVLIDNLTEHAGDIAVSGDGRLYISGPEKVWEVDTQTGSIIDTVFERRRHENLNLDPLWSEYLTPAPDGSIYIGDGSAIARIDTDGGVKKIAEGFLMAQGCAADGAGNLYVVTRSAGGVLKISGNECEYIYPPAHVNTPNKLALADDRVYIMQCETLNIKVYTTDAEYITTYNDTPQFPPFYDVAADGENNVYALYSSLPYYPNLPMVLAVFPDGEAEREILVEDFGEAKCMKYKNGQLYVLEEKARTIYTVDDSGNTDPVLKDLPMAGDFDVDSMGRFYYTVKKENSLTLSDGNETKKYPLPSGYHHIFSVYITENDEIYVLTEYNGGKAALLKHTGSGFMAIANQLPGASDVAVNDTGIYVTDYGTGCVYRVLPAS